MRCLRNSPARREIGQCRMKQKCIIFDHKKSLTEKKQQYFFAIFSTFSVLLIFISRLHVLPALEISRNYV